MTSVNNIIKGPKLPKPEDMSIEDLKYLSKDSFAMWTQTSGVKVDGNHIDFSNHRYLLPIYMDNGQVITVVKAAQTGLTTYMMLRIVWWLEQNQGRKGAIFFPTQAGCENLSKDRLGPLIDSCPSVKAISPDYNKDKLGLRKIGDSSLYILHLGGSASKDSYPLDFLNFDEVRLCEPKDIDQAQERISHSPYKIQVYASTCGNPGVDIDARFQYGTQLTWHSNCGCEDGVDLALTWPACVVHDDPKRPGEVYYRCPKCKYVIKNPQNGRYIAMNPGADHNSYRFPQLISPYLTPKEAWQFYNRTTNMSEFFNAKLGLPFIDAANRGVTLDQLNSNVNTSLTWAANDLRNGTAMGVDQGAGYCYVVIMDYNADRTKKRIRHVEVIESSNPQYIKNGQSFDPFDRCLELMEEYNVKIAVFDALPNHTSALKAAQTKPGKIFLAYYSHEQKETVIWQDKVKYKPGVQKAGVLLKFKYIAQIGRFPALSLALSELAGGDVTYAHPDGIVQMMRDEKTNVLAPESPMRRFFRHTTCMIKKYEEINEEESKGRWTWIHTGPDHFTHAYSYASVAMERLRRNVDFGFA